MIVEVNIKYYIILRIYITPTFFYVQCLPSSYITCILERHSCCSSTCARVKKHANELKTRTMIAGKAEQVIVAARHILFKLKIQFS